MVKHAADCVSRYYKGQDGLTPHRRLRGREFKIDVCEFGECVWYMKPGTVGKDKFDSKWEEGVWLGVVDSSGEKIIGTADGCIKVRSIKRKSGEDKWNKAMMESVRGVPWEVIPGHPERELKCRVIFERSKPEVNEQQTVDEPEEIIKRIYITKKDLNKYGRTEGCDGCRASLRGGRVSHTARHAGDA